MACNFPKTSMIITSFMEFVSLEKSSKDKLFFFNKETIS